MGGGGLRQKFKLVARGRQKAAYKKNNFQPREGRKGHKPSSSLQRRKGVYDMTKGVGIDKVKQKRKRKKEK